MKDFKYLCFRDVFVAGWKEVESLLIWRCMRRMYQVTRLMMMRRVCRKSEVLLLHG